MERPKLSVVSSLYRSRDSVCEFVIRSASAAEELTAGSYEIILVDDGSPTDDVGELIESGLSLEHVRILRLSRNFGHHPALMEGIRQARGNLVYLIDSDLEEQPEWLNDFFVVMEDQRADVVFGFEERRSGGLWRRLSGALYWRLMLGLSQLDIPPNIMTCRLMTRRYIDALEAFPERELSIGGIFALAGFKQVPLARQRLPRRETTYSFGRRVWHVVNSVTAFSSLPLIIFAAIAIAALGVGLLGSTFVMISSLLTGLPPAGWLSVLVSVWLVGGLCASGVALVGLYLSKVFVEVKARPRTIVASSWSGLEGGHPDDARGI